MTCSHNDALMTHSSFQLLVIHGYVSLQCFGNVLYVLLDFDSFLPSLQSLEFFLPLCVRVCVEETCTWGNCMPFFFYSNSNPSLLKLPFILVFIWKHFGVF